MHFELHAVKKKTHTYVDVNLIFARGFSIIIWARVIRFFFLFCLVLFLFYIGTLTKYDRIIFSFCYRCFIVFLFTSRVVKDNVAPHLTCYSLTSRINEYTGRIFQPNGPISFDMYLFSIISFGLILIIIIQSKIIRFEVHCNEIC